MGFGGPLCPWKFPPPHTGVRDPDRLTRSESLYRLRYPGRRIYIYIYIYIYRWMDGWMMDIEVRNIGPGLPVLNIMTACILCNV